MFWGSESSAHALREKKGGELGNRSESSPSKRPERHIYTVLFLLALELV